MITTTDDKLKSEYTSNLFEGSNLNYWPNIDYNAGRLIDFEFDSNGDFPLSDYTISTNASSHRSSSPSAGYATQDDAYDPKPKLPALF
jgi:hypothetical protein